MQVEVMFLVEAPRETLFFEVAWYNIDIWYQKT